jgi:glycosyltransferase involved in cell wall biosynthesis
MFVQPRMRNGACVRFSIVTPSFRQLDWLRLCVRSIEDQGVEMEHFIEDGGTGSELEEWVRSSTRAQLCVERDGGIYDALNRGFARTSGGVLAWLNCDEQYLPGALAAVEAEFAAHPELDVLLADNLIVDGSGKYLAHRFSLVPEVSQCWWRFPVSSCALFFRRRVWAPFDTQWKSSGDWWWFMAMLRRGARVGVMRRFVATFGETGENLGLSPVTRTEHAAIAAERPLWVRALAPAILLRHKARMLASGAQRVKPFDYEIYTAAGGERQRSHVPNPTANWRR